jgi:DNA modification methylase
MEHYIKYFPLSALKPADVNPKLHDLEELKESIRRFGFVYPVLKNETTGKLVAGHGRKEALEEMKAAGEPPPLGIVLKEGEWNVPAVCGVSFTDDDEAEAYLMADNRLVERGGWNQIQTGEILKRLSQRGKLRGTGFDATTELKKLASKLKDPLNAKSENLEVIKPAEEFNIERGQLYKIQSKSQPANYHRLFIGELSQAKSILPMFNGIFTAPPTPQDIFEDKVEIGNFIDWFGEIQEVMKNFLMDQGSLFLNIKDELINGERTLYVSNLVRTMRSIWKWYYIEEYYWNKVKTKDKKIIGRAVDTIEPIHQFSKRLDFYYGPNYYTATTEDDLLNSSQTNLISIPDDSEKFKDIHPRTFPVDLPKNFMMLFSSPGSVWLDPFIGSGTSIIAAEECSRLCFGIEINLEYAKKALERLSRLGMKIEMEKKI